MIRKILIWTCLLILLVSNVSAFFETPSNNILVQNNLYNGTFELNEINTTDLYVNGTQILPLNYVPYIGATTNVNLNNKNLTTTGDISANKLTLTSNIMFDSSLSDLYFKNTDASYNRGFIFQSNSIAGYVTLLDLSKNGGAYFQDLDITTTGDMFTQDISVSQYIKGVASTDMTLRIEEDQEFHFQKHDGISSYRDIFVLGTDADFKSRDIITLGDINAVNGVFSGNVTSDVDFCIDGGNCLSTVSSADGYIGDTQIHIAGGNLDMSNNNITNVSFIGIGTDTPSAKLDVKVNPGDDRSIILTDTSGDGTGHPKLTTSAGTLFLGSASGNFQLQADMLPIATNTYDLGSSARYFAEGYINDSYAHDLTVTNNFNAMTGNFTGNVTSDVDFCIDGGNCLSESLTERFNETKVIYSNNSVTVYNPISYYKEGVTEGQLLLKAPYKCKDCYVTWEVTAKAEGDYQKQSKYILRAKYDNYVFNSSFGSVIKENNGVDIFTTSDDIGHLNIAHDDVIGIGCGFSILSLSSYDDLEIVIDKLIISGTNTTLDWGKGWSIENIDTTFISNKYSQGYVGNAWNEFNDGVGSGLDADFFGGKNYQYYIYGSNTNGLKTWSNSTNISSVSANDRTYFIDYYGSEDIPFPYSSGSPHNWMLTQSLTSMDGYSMQIISPSSDLGTQYARWGYPIPSWTGWLKYMFNETTTNSIFTGNHTQNGTINITDSIESGNPHMEGYMTETQNVAVVDTWYNLTWNGSMGYIHGFILTNNQTLTATESGLYHIMFDLSVQSTSGVDEIIAFRIINDDGEMIGTYKEATITKQNADEWIINDEYVELKEGHNLTMQYLGSSTDLSIQTSNTYSDLDPYHGHAQITKTPLRVS